MKRKKARNSKNQCLGCNKHVTNVDDLSVCTGCFEASFCSRECQKIAWPTHRFDCLPCQICGKRIPGVPVHRDCACESKQGDLHISCLANAAADHSGGNEWSHTSFLWEKCKHCKQPFTEETKLVLEKERTARMEKAKERLKGLLAILRQGSYEDDEESSYCLDDDDDDLFRISSECIVLYRGLYGEDDWSSADLFWAHFHLASAFGRQDRKQKAIELLELAMAKLKMQQKFKGWSVLVREMSMKLAANYFCQNGRFLEAQPLCEMVYEKYYQQLPEETKLWLRCSLIVCYKYTRSWKKARELVERACKENKQVYGHENAGGYEFLGLRDKIFRSSDNTAHTFGVDGILDGTIVETDSYDNFGYFHASVLCENSCDDDYSCGYNQRLAVPVDEVIMLPDSDIALHSLNGAEWKIGCRGRFQQRNRAIRRHSRGKRKDCQRQASKCPPGLHGVREGENGCSCKGAIQPR